MNCAHYIQLVSYNKPCSLDITALLFLIDCSESVEPLS